MSERAPVRRPPAVSSAETARPPREAAAGALPAWRLFSDQDGVVEDAPASAPVGPFRIAPSGPRAGASDARVALSAAAQGLGRPGVRLWPLLDGSEPLIALQKTAPARRGRPGVQTFTLGFRAVDFAAIADGVLAELPRLLEEEAKRARRDDAMEFGFKAPGSGSGEAERAAATLAEAAAGAARLRAALAADGAVAAFGTDDFADAAAFWRAVGALAAETPEALRSAVSAASFDAPAARAEPGSESAPSWRASLEPGPAALAADRPLLVFDPSLQGGAASRRAAEDGAAIAVADAVDPAPPLGVAAAALADASIPLRAWARRETPSDATTDAIGALGAFLSDLDGAPPPALEGLAALEARTAYLRVLVAAAHDGVQCGLRDESGRDGESGRDADGVALAPFGVARALGLVAAAAEPAFVEAWRRLGAEQPHRAYWSALLFETPADFTPPPIERLADAARLFARDAEVRGLLPPDARTPLDSAAAQTRLAAVFEQVEERLALDPEVLARPALAVRGAPDAAQAARADEDAATLATLRPDFLADAGGAAATLLAEIAAVATVGRGDNSDENSGENSGDDTPLSGRLTLAVENVAAASQLGDALAAATSAQTEQEPDIRARAVAARWLGAEAAAPDGAGARFWRRGFDAALAALPANGTVCRLLLELWLTPPLEAAQARRAAYRRLVEGTSAAGAAGAALEADIGARVATVFADPAAWTAPGGAGGQAERLRFGAETARLFRALARSAPNDGLRGRLRKAAAAAFDGLDAALDAAGMFGALERDPPALAMALAEELALMSFALGPPQADATPDEPTRRASGCLAAIMELRFGPGLARMIGDGLVAFDPAPAQARRVRASSLDTRNMIKEIGAAAWRVIAANSVNLWRRHFHAKLAERAAGDGGGAPIGLAPFDDPTADELALRVVAWFVRNEEAAAEAALGEDAAWAVRQFIDLAGPLEDRPPPPPAPPAVLDGWRALANAPRRSDLTEPEQFFLFLAAKLMQRVEDPRHADKVTQPFWNYLNETAHSVQTPSGLLPIETKNRLRHYLYLAPGEEAGSQALDPGAPNLAARLDRAMFFLALVYQSETSPHDERWLWPRFAVKAAVARRLTPPRRAVDALAAHLRGETAQRAAFLAILERTLLITHSDWSEFANRLQPAAAS